MLVKVCSLKVLPPESMKQFAVKDREVLLINTAGGFFCLEARCTHAGAPLAEGTLEGKVLTCPWHGSQFRITDGAVLRGPAEKKLETYAVVLKETALFIEL